MPDDVPVAGSHIVTLPDRGSLTGPAHRSPNKYVATNATCNAGTRDAPSRHGNADPCPAAGRSGLPQQFAEQSAVPGAAGDPTELRRAAANGDVQQHGYACLLRRRHHE